MVLLFDFTVVVIGALIVLWTAKYAIKGSVGIAKHFGLSNELIGMTVLAIGTSLPEIITAVMGSVEILAHPGNILKIHEFSALVVGTNVGSDIFQQCIILSIVGFLAVVSVKKIHLIRDMGGLIAATILFLVLCINGVLSRWEGALLVFLYIGYLYYLKKHDLHEKEKVVHEKNHVLKFVAMALVSFIVMGFAADRILTHATFIVEQLNISASFFGIVFLGIVTALPELMTSLIAIIRGKSAISAGILIGSNITNPMLALGLGAMISSYTVPNVTVFMDLPFKLLTAFVILFFFWRYRDIKKWNAVFLVLLYLAFIFFRRMYFPVDF